MCSLIQLPYAQRLFLLDDNHNDIFGRDSLWSHSPNDCLESNQEHNQTRVVKPVDNYNAIMGRYELT